jgi:hypothetical protein
VAPLPAAIAAVRVSQPLRVAISGRVEGIRTPRSIARGKGPVSASPRTSERSQMHRMGAFEAARCRAGPRSPPPPAGGGPSRPRPTGAGWPNRMRAGEGASRTILEPAGPFDHPEIAPRSLARGPAPSGRVDP